MLHWDDANGDDRAVRMPRLIAADEPLALAATNAVQAGDLTELRRLLGEHPWLATARIGDEGMSRTLLHAATDWPGHYPNNVDTIRILVDAGADVDARFHGGHVETPLHWAASSDDVDVIDALLLAGADIEAEGAVLGGGSPLADATGFGQWNAARLLVERGAVMRLSDAAGIGMIDRMEAIVSADPPDQFTLDAGLWSACNGDQQRAAEFLVVRGANVNWIGWDDMTPLDVAVHGGHHGIADWLRSRGARTVVELRDIET